MPLPLLLFLPLLTVALLLLGLEMGIKRYAPGQFGGWFRQGQLIAGAALPAYLWHGFSKHQLQEHMQQNFARAGVSEASPAARFAYMQLESCVYVGRHCLADAAEAVQRTTFPEEDHTQALRLIYSFYRGD